MVKRFFYELKWFIEQLGPETWWFFHPEQCDALLFPKQSPVNLDMTKASRIRDGLKSGNFDTKPSTVRLKNDGNALTLTTKYEAGTAPWIERGPLIPGYRYTLDHMVWHWGPNDTLGGEHTILGKRY